jgi:uncharacterized protein (TIGR02147 family)
MKTNKIVAVMKSIFDYSDYRAYLADFYQENKAQNPGFSYRFMAQHVGFKSAGHFTKIIQGKANISVSLALRFAEFFKFNKKQTEYFQSLVLYNQAKNHQDKRRYFEKMLTFKNAKIITVNGSQYEFFEKWYYTVVRETLAVVPIKDNFAELAARIVPAITEKEAKKAIDVLERLGFVVRDNDGYYRQANPLLMADRDTASLAVDNFILSNIDLARQSIDRFPKKERKLAATTLTISKTTYDKIVNELFEFRRHILTLAEQDQHPERTYQFNFQVFPVSAAAPAKENV